MGARITDHVLMAEHRCELDKIKGSRFTATAVSVADEQAAMAVVERVRAEFPDASHHCYGWRILGDRFRYSDDGEPSGTGGKPILSAIDGRKLRQTVVVVTRWFGGTKLGAGGLVRAYGGAAAAVLREAQIELYVARVTLEIRFGYGDQGAIAGVLHAAGLTADESEYAEDVCFRLVVREELAAGLIERLVDRTAGRAKIRGQDPPIPIRPLE